LQVFQFERKVFVEGFVGFVLIEECSARLVIINAEVDFYGLTFDPSLDTLFCFSLAELDHHIIRQLLL
jgi:hypothetical protein